MPRRNNPDRYREKRRLKFHRKRKPIKRPFLLPNCPIEYARGLYQGEGSAYCSVDEKNKRARLGADIGIYDREALEPVSPCFGVSPREDARRGWVLERRGKPALEIAKALSVTPTRKQQIQNAIERCKRHWQKGYSDQVEV